MERMPMTERGQPDFEGEEVVMIKTVWRRLGEMIEAHSGADVINREVVWRFCAITETLQDLARGNPEPLRRYLELS
jgi:hypothetical protein